MLLVLFLAGVTAAALGVAGIGITLLSFGLDPWAWYAQMLVSAIAFVTGTALAALGAVTHLMKGRLKAQRHLSGK